MKHIKYIFPLLLLLLLAACATAGSAPALPPEGTEDWAATAPVQEPVAVQITMDNWQEYFELRETEQVYQSESCDVINRVFGYGVFLKDAYTDRLAEGSDVAFELEYNLVWRRVLGDLAGDSYSIHHATSDEQKKTQQAQLVDFRGRTDISEESDFFGSVAVEFAFDSEFSA